MPARFDFYTDLVQVHSCAWMPNQTLSLTPVSIKILWVRTAIVNRIRVRKLHLKLSLIFLPLIVNILDLYRIPV